MKVPFNKPILLPEHQSSFARFVDPQGAGSQLSGNGNITKKVEKELSESCAVPARLVTSATHALEMMALLLNIVPGDEVIVPSFGFVSTANAFALRGATLRFADNDEFGNIKLSEVERLTNSKTRAVVALHYAGNSADLEQISKLLQVKAPKAVLLEDAAQSIGAKYKGRPLGSIGSLGCFSFHDTKNVTAGEGGALIFGDQSFVERAEILREKGTNRSLFLQGLVDKYTWVDLGSSYVLSELCAAYLEPQLSKIDHITAVRGKIWNRYYRELAPDLERSGAKVLEVPRYNTSNNHLFAFLFNNAADRPKFIQDMKSAGITAPFHYVSLHSAPFGRRFYPGERHEKLAGADRFSMHLVRLPLYYNMTESEQTYVIERVRDWLKKA